MSINQIRLFDALRIITKNPRVRNLSQDIRIDINNIVAQGNIYRENILQLRRIINERNTRQREIINRKNIVQTRETINNNDIIYYIKLNRCIRLLSRINSILMNINNILG